MNRGALLLGVLLFTVLAPPASASADAVALLPLGGRAAPERVERVEQLVAARLRAQGHRLAPPAEASVGHPPALAELEAVAEASRAIYVVTGEVEPPLGRPYRLHLHVYYRPAGRLEDLLVEVFEEDEEARIDDILRSMVRREGLGEDALRLTGEQESPEERARREAEEAARREAEEAARREAEEAARREAEEAARREAEEAARREAEARERERRAWEARPRYGADAPWMAQLLVGGRYAATLGALPTPRASGGGGLFDVGLRIGRTFEGVEGFELRGGVDVATGAFGAIGLHAGAAWLGSFFLEPVFIGLGGEVGVVFTLTGARDVGFSGRVGALFAWRPAEHLYLEASLPELGYVSPGAGALSVGASLRGGLRF